MNLSNLTKNPEKMKKALNIEELDKMIHDLFLGAQFKMHYELEESGIDVFEPTFKLNVHSDQNLLKAPAFENFLFKNVLLDCRIECHKSELYCRGNELVASFTLSVAFHPLNGEFDYFDAGIFTFRKNHWTRKVEKYY